MKSNQIGILERCAILSRSLGGHPKLSLGHFPTPLEPLDRLSEIFGGPRIWVKRDDCSGLATGGNKTRKLEFLMADAIKKGATLIIAYGAIQSNHVRQTAAAARRCGLKCHVILEDRTGYRDPDYAESGNVLLDQILGIEITYVPGDTDMPAAAASLGAALSAQDEKCYIIPAGGSNAVGTLGYIDCAREILQQCDALGFSPDAVVHASGSAGTQAGLLAGFACLEADVPVLGISVRADREKQEGSVYDLASTTMDHLGMGYTINRESVTVDSRFIGAGYGLPTPGGWEVIRMAAELEGLFFDPVYTCKGLDGLRTLIAEGAFAAASNIVFIHTGGAAALFGYRAHMEGLT